MRMVSPALGAAGAHADVLPAPSIGPELHQRLALAGDVYGCCRSAATDQVAPPLVDVRYS